MIVRIVQVVCIIGPFCYFAIYKLENTQMSLGSNFRVLIGVLIVCEAYILLNSAEQRYHFQGIILRINQYFNIQAVSYRTSQIVRFTMIALMYTAGTSVIFDVGPAYTSKYFILKCLIQAVGLFQGVSYIRSGLVICIHMAFYLICLRISRQYADELLAKSQQKIVQLHQISQASQRQNNQAE